MLEPYYKQVLELEEDEKMKSAQIDTINLAI